MRIVPDGGTRKAQTKLFSLFFWNTLCEIEEIERAIFHLGMLRHIWPQRQYFNETNKGDCRLVGRAVIPVFVLYVTVWGEFILVHCSLCRFTFRHNSDDSQHTTVVEGLNFAFNPIFFLLPFLSLSLIPYVSYLPMKWGMFPFSFTPSISVSSSPPIGGLCVGNSVARSERDFYCLATRVVKLEKADNSLGRIVAM